MSRAYRDGDDYDSRSDRRREHRSRHDDDGSYETRAYRRDNHRKDRHNYKRSEEYNSRSGDYPNETEFARHDRSRQDVHRIERSYERERDRGRDRERRGSSNEIGDRNAQRSRSPTERPTTSGPNFERSGLLARESNSMNGVALKYHEPPEARRPKTNWRMFVFKNGKEIGTSSAHVDMLVIGRQSCYLFGRDRSVVDVPIEHPSCSKQHAVVQFRQVTHRNEFGDERRLIQYVFYGNSRPFLIDLDSANGSTVNGEDVPPSRYYELRSGDTCQFGASSREYVLLDEANANGVK